MVIIVIFFVINLGCIFGIGLVIVNIMGFLVIEWIIFGVIIFGILIFKNILVFIKVFERVFEDLMVNVCFFWLRLV